jgi:hypothetical protein
MRRREFITLAEVKPALLATMHGASFSGDGTAGLRGLADEYDVRLRAARMTTAINAVARWGRQ